MRSAETLGRLVRAKFRSHNLRLYTLTEEPNAKRRRAVYALIQEYKETAERLVFQVRRIS
jgi:hypothetical protein